MSHSFDEQRLALARLYAGATRRLAAEQGIEEDLLEEVQGLVEVLDRNPELAAMFTSPLVEPRERSATLERALRGRASDLLVDALQVMNRKRRLGLLREFAEAYRREFEKAHGIVEVEVTTAVPLSDELRRSTEVVASRLAGAKARLRESVDESLLGGMVMQVGDRKVDTTLARDLAILRDRLMERASQEVLSGTAWVTPDAADSE